MPTFFRSIKITPKFLAWFCCLPAGIVIAATATTTFTVQTTVSAACSIAATDLNFGPYNPTLGTSLPGTSTVTVTCTSTTPYNIGLDKGQGTGASVINRIMKNGSNVINYSLYQDSNHATVWGDTVGTNTIPGTGTGAAQSPLIVYGLIFSSQSPSIPPGTYLDTIIATITF